MSIQDFFNQYGAFLVGIGTVVGGGMGWFLKAYRSGIRDKFALEHNTEAISNLTKVLEKITETMNGMSGRLMQMDTRVGRVETDTIALRQELLRHVEKGD
jgi:hypothetical protein